MKTIQDLTKHMSAFKDAVVILGPDAVTSIKKRVDKSLIENSFNKKALRRTPKEFWETFSEKIYIAPDTTKVYSGAQLTAERLYHMGLVKKIIDTTGSGTMKLLGCRNDLIELHGSAVTFTCQNPQCKCKYPHDYVFNQYMLVKTECEVCGKPLRPDILLVGENYDDDVFYNAKKAIFETHTLILIGIDMTEEPIIELIGQFGDIKTMAAADGNPEIQKMLVTIQDPSVELDINEIAFSEFLSKDNCDEASKRLFKAIAENSNV